MNVLILSFDLNFPYPSLQNEGKDKGGKVDVK